jgi:hypothetical protein
MALLPRTPRGLLTARRQTPPATVQTKGKLERLLALATEPQACDLFRGVK